MTAACVVKGPFASFVLALSMPLVSIKQTLGSHTRAMYSEEKDHHRRLGKGKERKKSNALFSERTSAVC